MKRELLLIGIFLVSGCGVTETQNQEAWAYFESCNNNPDGYWNADEQKCESNKQKIDEWFGEDSCIDLSIVDEINLKRYTNYSISFNNKTYLISEFNKTYEEIKNDDEYIYEYESVVVCEPYGTLQLTNIHLDGWYTYRIRMPYCKGNDSITFRICEND